jgi:hypothetical protein
MHTAETSDAFRAAGRSLVTDPVKAPAKVPVGLILRAWRDGSVHAEVPFAAFHDEDGEIHRHLAQRGNRSFETACGVAWFGVASTSGYGSPHAIDCEDCRAILLG